MLDQTQSVEWLDAEAATASEAFRGVGTVRNTIDTSNNDNGYLANARRLDPGAGAHSSTAQAASNLAGFAIASVGGGVFRITGHGNDGIITTGTGQQIIDSPRYISVRSQSDWQGPLGAFRGRCQRLELWGCHVGTGDAGADLLYALAQVIGSAVAAPTGFMYCNPDGMKMEPGSQWQEARPGYRPPAIAAPTPHLERASMSLRLLQDGRELSINEDQIHTAIFEPASRAKMDALNAPRDLAEVLRAEPLGEPQSIGGPLGALVTGALTITVRGPGGKDIERRFIVLNDRLLQDETTPERLYRAGPALMAAMTG